MSLDMDIISRIPVAMFSVLYTKWRMGINHPIHCIHLISAGVFINLAKGALKYYIITLPKRLTRLTLNV